jgi:carboxyl-terminal processing protease
MRTTGYDWGAKRSDSNRSAQITAPVGSLAAVAASRYDRIPRCRATNMTRSRMTVGNTRPHAILAAGLCLAFLGGCGGGGGGGGSLVGGGNSWTQGVFRPASNFRALCVNPRSGTNPATGQPFPDRAGTRTDENNFLRSYSNNTYLWYDEIVDRNPAQYTTPDYFDLLKTDATTASGADKDKFHFTYDSAEYYALSQSGASSGYGAQWVLVSSRPPREVRVAFTEPNSPATAAGLLRGAELLQIDGVDVVNGSNVDALNNGLFPAGAGETHQFRVRDPDGTVRDISMTSAIITSAPVQNVQTISTPSGNVGYLLFNDHILPAEQALIDAVTQLAADNITDLVVDLRYNGGGFLFIASEFAYMIAGNAATAGRTFEVLRFNDKHPTTNPVTGQPISPTPFYSTDNQGNSLPSLNLSRVFVLTGPGTCSASESVMNSLRGVGIEVIQIGSTTCGKPYGFYPTDNCGTTYFTIQFRGENEQGFGDYTDGFSPANAGIPTTVLPGCQVADDFSRQLGDPLEARFAAALQYRNNGSCPAPSSVTLPGAGKPALRPVSDDELVLPRAPWRENRIVGGR